MKKLIAIVLTVATVCNITLSAGALGIDKVIHEKDGTVLTYVSGEKIDEYHATLNKEVNECIEKFWWWSKPNMRSAYSKVLNVLPTVAGLISGYSVAHLMMKCRSLLKNNNKFALKVAEKSMPFWQDIIMYITIVGTSFGTWLYFKSHDLYTKAYNCSVLYDRYKSITNSINADYQNSKEYGVVIKCKKDNFDFIECMTWPQDYKDENAKRTKKTG